MPANATAMIGQDARFADRTRGNALVVTRDNLAGRWAPTWLEHAGLDVQRANTPQQAVQIASDACLSLIIADSGLTVGDGTCLLKRLMEVSARSTVVIGLCATEQDCLLANDANPTGSFPAPFDWQAITRHCVKLVVARDIVEELNASHDQILRAREHSELTRKARLRAPRAAMQTKSPYPTVSRIDDI